MKWKQEVVINKKKIYELYDGNKIKQIAVEDAYIVEAIEKGITDDKELTALVMKKENMDEVMAGFRLIQFVLDYGDYISNDLGHMIIET